MYATASPVTTEALGSAKLSLLLRPLQIYVQGSSTTPTEQKSRQDGECSMPGGSRRGLRGFGDVGITGS